MKKVQKGLSLMEVMVTLVIVAIIAGFAYPRYQKMVLRSKQTEAKTILQSIYMAQDLFLTANQNYSANMDDLDIEVPTGSIYAFTLSVGDDGSTFVARATANLDNDVALDEWQIDQNNNLTNPINDIIEE